MLCEGRRGSFCVTQIENGERTDACRTTTSHLENVEHQKRRRKNATPGRKT
jgi:hypothetical protein